MTSDQIQDHIERIKHGMRVPEDTSGEQAMALWEIAKQLARMNEGEGLDTGR